MKSSTISLFSSLSLYFVLPVGLILLILWELKIIPILINKLEKKRILDIDSIALIGIVYMIPGIVIFCIFSIPVFYFNNLQKKEDYCIKLIQINHLKKDDPFLDSRCGSLDRDEIFERSKL